MDSTGLYWAVWRFWAVLGGTMLWWAVLGSRESEWLKKKTLPNALRTQALTALTSNFDVVDLVWQIWFGLVGLVWFGLVCLVK